MEGTAVSGRLIWRLSEVVESIVETPRAKSLVVKVPGWPGHRPGQHVDVRLTAPDGYQAQRSYSIATAPCGEQIAITVERLDDGEVSTYLADVPMPGDALELRGPIGGYFTWDVEDGGPLLLVAGGSGIAPLMAMIRHRAKTGDRVPTRLLYSARTYPEVIYQHELTRLAEDDHAFEVIWTLTRGQPPDWTGYQRRIDAEMLSEVAWPVEAQPLCYVCGPTSLVENVATALVTLGYDPSRIRTERFGPTG
jgi:ferredoxin-NADP reductase